MPIKNRFAEWLPELRDWRRHIHERPELMYDLHETAGFVADRLRAFGVDEVIEGVGQTGVVGIIRGRATTSNRTIGLRADMDALPIHEETGLPHASQTPGAMHACGHDGHTTMLLGAARYLAETRNFDGSVVLIFQPAEEGGAGAKAMLDDGLLQKAPFDEVYGIHNAPGVPVGVFATRPGALLASSDEFEITVRGQGGHAAEPHRSIDTTLVAAHIVVALHSIVSRSVDPIKRVVLTVGTFKTDSNASNVIPDTATMEGTVRTLDPAYRAIMEARVREVATNTAAAFGATADVDWVPGYPVTINDEAGAAHAIAAATAAGTGVIGDADPIMPSEDFSYFLQERPGAYIFLGNGDSAMCHHPMYDFDDEAIPYGCSFFAEIVERRLPTT